jgi:hypothetical protein
LNFPSIVRDSIAPFVKFASSIGIEDENSHNEKITLFFKEMNYSIIVSWDRLIFKSEIMDFSNLYQNNSIVEEPFFNLFDKITKMSGFGEIRNYLSFSIFVKPIDKDITEITEDFIKRYLNISNVNGYLPCTDLGINFERKKDGSQTFYNLGPYTGIEDFKKRNIDIKNRQLIDMLNCYGEMFEFKFFEESKTLSFKKYKEISADQMNFIEKQWKQ